LLNSVGIIHIFGTFPQAPHENMTVRGRLEFPSSYPATTATKYEAMTAIKQFSQGRSYSLGLSDNGNIWLWKHHQAVLVESSNVNLDKRRVTRVVAGKSSSSRSLPRGVDFCM
jgi:hypothetical protein